MVPFYHSFDLAVDISDISLRILVLSSSNLAHFRMHLVHQLKLEISTLNLHIVLLLVHNLPVQSWQFFLDHIQRLIRLCLHKFHFLMQLLL